MTGELELLSRLRKLGVRVWTRRGDLHYSAPPGVLTAELRAELVAAKTPLAALLERFAQVQEPASAALVPATRTDGPIPLSHGQRRMLFLQQLAPDKPIYSMPTTLLLRGRIDAKVLRRAFEDIVRRHEILRIRFVVEDEEYRQVVVAGPLPWWEIGPEGADSLDAALTLARREAATPFDMASELVRCLLVTVAPDEHVLMLNLHHAIADGWSVDLLVREMADRYTGLTAGHTAVLPKPQVGYLDHVVAQRDTMRGDQLDRQLRFWREALEGAPTTLDLPADRKRPVYETFHGVSRRSVLPDAAAVAVRDLARGENTTSFVVLLAAFGVLLHRCTGQDDILIGTPVAGRTQLGTQDLVGLFVNTLVLRADLTGDPAFPEVVRRVRQLMLDVQGYEELPYDLLIEHLKPRRDPGRNPLFQVLFVYEAAGPSAPEFAGVRAEETGFDQGEVAKVDLTLVVRENAEGGLSADLTVASALFLPSTAQRLLDQFTALVLAVADEPGCPISTLDLLGSQTLPAPSAEQPALARTAPDHTLPELISVQTRRTPDGEAVCAGDVRLTYAELARRVDRVAAALVRRGARPGALIGVAIPRCAELVVALCAVLRTGAAYMPIEEDLPAQRVSFILDDAQPLMVVSGADVAKWSDEPAEAVTVAGPDPGDPAYALYTSGSTGLPKAVVITHGAVCNRLLWMKAEYEITAQDRVLQKTPVSFDVSVWELFLPLISGATLVLAAPGAHREPLLIDRLLRAERITTVHFVPSMLRVFLQESQVGAVPSVRLVICSGEELTVELQELFFARMGTRLRLHNLYGPTEAAIDVSHWACEPGANLPEVPIGHPVWNTGLHVLDPRLCPVPPGVLGELYLTGVQLAQGYLNRPGLTAQRFVAAPWGGRMFRTGDLARLREDGAVVYQGRVDDQVKIRGQRIELGEVEAVLARHPGTAAVAVAAKPDPDGGSRLVAYLVPDPVRAAPVAEFARQEREDALPGFHRHRLSNGMAVYARSQAEADFLYREIYQDREYLRHGITLPPDACVFDVGAHIGLFTLYAGLACPDGVVYSFEPIPQLFRCMRANTEAYGVNVVPLPFGAADRDSTATFTFYPELPMMSGRFGDSGEEHAVAEAYARNELLGDGIPLDRNTDGELRELVTDRLHGEQVECRLSTVSEVIAERGVTRVDLLKIDAEKSEWDVLCGVRPEHWPLINQVVAAVHDFGGRLGRIVAMLTEKGFEVTSEVQPMLETTSLARVYARRPGGSPGTRPDWAPPRWSDPDAFAGEVKVLAAAELPGHLVPSGFAVVDALPLTTSGKLDRKALPEPVWGAAALRGRGPATPIEEVLCGYVAEVLGIDRVSAEDDFFALGGHSLLAMRLLSRVRTTFGAELNLRDMFEAPTAATLAERVTGAQRADPLAVVLPLRSAGSRAPLFCVHPAAGLSWCYSGLLRYLDPSVPVYGLQDVAVTGASAPSAVEDMASLYVSRLRQVQPTGPYHLLGWSFGGLVAHAAAVALQEAGEEVALLAILDTSPFNTTGEITGERDEPDRWSALREMVESLGYAVGQVRRMEDVMAFLEDAGSALALLDTEQIEALAQAFSANVRRAERFTPRRFDGDITLVTTDGDLGAAAKRWQPYATGCVVAQQVDCTHEELLGPGAHALGTVLAEALSCR